MHLEAVRSLQFIHHVDPDHSGLANLVKHSGDEYLKSYLRLEESPTPLDPGEAHANAIAELHYLTDCLAARLDLVKKLVPGITSRWPKKASEPVYCICRREAFGDMVGCDDPECPYEWYHLECVGISVAPKGKWLCPSCRERIGLKSPSEPKRRRRA